MRQSGIVAVLAGVLLAAALGQTGCTARKTSGRDLKMIEPWQAERLVKGEKKLFGLVGSSTTAVVDPRSERDYRAGHLPGALSIPFQEVSDRFRQLKGYDLVLVYGSDYDDVRAEAMSKRLLELGIKDVRTLRGGVRSWLDAGFVLETE